MQRRYGPDAVAVFGGGSLTNEKAYLLGKFARVALGTANIDYNGRFCMSSAAAAQSMAFGVDRGLPFPIADMRVRMSNGHTNAEQIRTLAEITREVGAGFVDVTTRQQIQRRGFEIGNVPEIWRRLEKVGLASLQTGMDNIRNVVGCPAAGLTPHELFDRRRLRANLPTPS